MTERDEGEGAAVVPNHLKLACIVDVVNGSLGTGRYRSVRIVHFRKPDTCAGWKLLLHKFHPFGVLPHFINLPS